MAVAQLMSHPTVVAQVGQVLAPSTYQHQVVDPTANYFATPVLVDGTGDVVEALQGTRAVTGMLIGGATIQFTFTDLAISAPGAYNIRLDLYKMSATGADLVTQANWAQITVYN
ncbi:hypothetical protein V8C34DRAFT_117836 [Trichoderma compactum]